VITKKQSSVLGSPQPDCLPVHNRVAVNSASCFCGVHSRKPWRFSIGGSTEAASPAVDAGRCFVPAAQLVPYEAEPLHISGAYNLPADRHKQAPLVSVYHAQQNFVWCAL